MILQYNTAELHLLTPGFYAGRSPRNLTEQ